MPHTSSLAIHRLSGIQLYWPCSRCLPSPAPLEYRWVPAVMSAPPLSWGPPVKLETMMIPGHSERLGSPEDSDVQPRSSPWAGQWPPQSQVLGTAPRLISQLPQQILKSDHGSWLSSVLARCAQWVWASPLHPPPQASVPPIKTLYLLPSVKRQCSWKHFLNYRPPCKCMLMIKISKQGFCPMKGSTWVPVEFL